MDPGTVSMRVALCYDLLRFIPGSPYLFRSFRILRICSCKSRSCVCFENSFVLSIAKRAFVVSCCGYPSSEYWAREIWMHRSSNNPHSNWALFRNHAPDRVLMLGFWTWVDFHVRHQDINGNERLAKYCIFELHRLIFGRWFLCAEFSVLIFSSFAPFYW